MTLMMIMMPLQQKQQHQLEDGNDAIATRATMQLQIRDVNTIDTKATTPAQQQQECLHINNGNNAIIMKAKIAIAMMAKMPVHQWQ
jgi:hypothetical protein